jgi:hypothetical protein
MPHSPTVAVASHEASYAVAGRVLGIKVRPPRFDRGVMRNASGVIDADPNATTPEDDERAALLMFIADAALHQFVPTEHGRDHVEGRELVLMAFQKRHGLPCLKNQNTFREFNLKIASLQEDAESFVREHKAEISRAADDMRDRRRHQRRSA